MHPRQASVLVQATEVADRIAAKKQSEKKQGLSSGGGGLALLWKYTDPEGNTFYLEEKKMTIKSPYSGKSFSARPERHTPAQVGKEMKDEAKAEKAAPKTASDFWKA